ncbi:MAG: hypothetical protein EXQ48_04295 [Acidobacteria bacterium]|nr:hypothetical protein [Acidobacteriota bacterium]
MARNRNRGNATVNASAEIAGRALGQVARRFDEALETLTAGQEKLTDWASEAGARATAVIKKTKSRAKKTRKAATRARSRSVKLVAKATRTSRRAVTRAKTAVKRARKTVSRRAARLKH